MPSVPPWTPDWDFGSDPEPQNLVNAEALQSQFLEQADFFAQQEVALARVIRDDDTLVDELVRLRNLHPELADYLKSRTEGSIATEALDYRFPVRAASTANLASLVDVQTVDGVTLASGDRILLKDQTNAAENGIWIVYAIGDPTPHNAGLWERSTDLPGDAASDKGWAVIVRDGTLNGSTAWMPVVGGTTAEQPIVGTDDLLFMPVFAPFPLPISRGGTGATTIGDAAANLGFARKQTDTITGDGMTTSFTITHTLASAALVVAVQDGATGADVLVSVIKTTSNVSIAFVTAPTLATTYTVTIIG